MLRDTIKMMGTNNNLKKYIKSAGMSHAEVAEQKGIAPESLSRHISGRSQFSIQDAMDYAEILNCDPSVLLFEPTKVKVYGTVVDAHTVTMKNASDPEQFIASGFRFPPFVGAFLDTRTDYNIYLQGCINFVDIRPIQNQMVPQSSFGKNSIIKLSNGEVLQRCIYPNPDKTFTIVSYSGKVETNQNLVFACPVLSRVERPELLGVEII